MRWLSSYWLSLGASHSSEAVDVESAVLSGVVVASRATLVASLHVLEHLSALGVAQLVSRSTEVVGEERAEGWDRGGNSNGTGNLQRVGRSEQVGGVDLESLHIGMLEHANGLVSIGLEGVTGNERGMCVVYTAVKRRISVMVEEVAERVLAVTYKQDRRTVSTRFWFARISF